MKIKNKELIMENINNENINNKENDKQELTIDERVKIAESLHGILKDRNVTLEEAREERVKKYLQ